MYRKQFSYLLTALFLAGCSSNQWTFEPASGKKYAVKDPTTLEIMAGYDYLHGLHEHSLIPGDTKEMHGTPAKITREVQLPPKEVEYPFSWTYYIVLNGQPGFTNCYTVGRASKTGEWRLERAWRVDVNGLTVKEWQLK